MAKLRLPTPWHVSSTRAPLCRTGAPAVPGQIALLPCLLLLISLCLALAYAATPVAGDELPLDASVTVVAPADEAYGASLDDAHRSLVGERALGPPDGESAILLNGGRLVLELAGTVGDCTSVSLWAARAGWGKAGFLVHVSADGREWRRLGAGEGGSDLARHELSGDWGEVRYLRVSRTGGWLAVLLLDAVGAKGVMGQQESP